MNIKSTNELENGGKLEFEDVFLCRKKKDLYNSLQKSYRQ